MFCPGLKRASAAGEASDGAGSGPAACGLIVRVAVRVDPPPVPVIVTAVALATELVVTVKLALVAPAATVTLAGTEAAAFELERLTTIPPLGAALVRVAVPVEEAPPVSEDGFREVEPRLAGGGTGLTVSAAVRVVVPCVPVIVTGVALATELVVTAKVALVAPAATVTLAGTAAAAVLELARFTRSPPLGAAPVSATVPVEPLPPTTLDGLTLTADRLATGGAPRAVKRRVPENGPLTPAELMPRTRQKSRCAGRPLMVACDVLTVCVKVSGFVNVLALSIWMR